MRRSAFLLTCLLLPGILGAQGAGAPAASRSGKRPLLERAVEIALARSAAPQSVSGNARVLVLSDTGFIGAVAGTNGVTCIVNRSWPKSLEPHCYDEEGSATILPMEMRRTTLLHLGRPVAEVDTEIAAGLADGRYRLPRRPAVSYMMSEAQQLINDDGAPAGNWRPHLMIYYPYLTNRDVGFAQMDMAVGMVSDERKPTANLMVIMPAFVKVVPQ